LVTDKKDIQDAMIGVMSDHAMREQLAKEQGEDFDEDMRVTLAQYIESLPEDERVIAWSLQNSERGL